MAGQLLVLQVLESGVPVATESFNCRSGPGGILLITNQDTARRWGHVELKALVKLSGEYRSTIDLLTLSPPDGSAGVGADRYCDVLDQFSTAYCLGFFFLSVKRTGRWQVTIRNRLSWRRRRHQPGFALLESHQIRLQWLYEEVKDSTLMSASKWLRCNKQLNKYFLSR